MISPDQIRAGLRSVPGFVDEYGMKGGLLRWSGIVSQRLFGDIDGRSVFDADWDICIILDACRADELERQQPDYDWIEPVDRFSSVASCTWNWVPRTVESTDTETLQETTYVTANPFPSELTEAGTFGAIDEVYRYAWDDEHGTVYPRPVTDRAIQHWRSNESERLIVHYLQPHVPFLCEEATALSRVNFTHEETSEHDAWDRVTRGDLERAEAIKRYRASLARVLDDVDILLSSIDADRVVVTADHGEAFGEWGLYGHPQGIDLPCLTEVPWVTTTATDTGEYEPASYETNSNTVATDEQLRALGYTT